MAEAAGIAAVLSPVSPLTPAWRRTGAKADRPDDAPTTYDATPALLTLSPFFSCFNPLSDAAKATQEWIYLSVYCALRLVRSVGSVFTRGDVFPRREVLLERCQQEFPVLRLDGREAPGPEHYAPRITWKVARNISPSY